MKPLRIAIVCDGVTSMTGGAFVSTLRFAKLLRERGHAVVIITTKQPGEKPVDTYDELRVYRFPSILIPKTEGRHYMSFPRRSRIKDILLKEKIDVVHIVSPTPSSIVTIRAAKALGIRIVAHSHTQPENIFLHAPKFLRLRKIYSLFYGYLLWLYGRADITICPSPFSERALKRIDGDLKTVVISNGVDPCRFRRINPEPFIEKFGIPRDAKRMLFVGRIHPEKRVETMVRSIPHILRGYENIHVIVVGSGYLLDGLKRLSIELGVGKKVTFCGKVSDGELVMALSACDIFAFPSLAELEGMAVLEAMACANPILVANSKESASTDFVQGNGFLFEPDDAEDLAQKALSLLMNEPLRQSMALASLELSKAYDIHRSVEALEKLYYSL